jgi:hypothetical protein
MLKKKKDNSRVITQSSSIDWFKVSTIPMFSFNMEFIVMALFKASLHNQ